MDKTEIGCCAGLFIIFLIIGGIFVSNNLNSTGDEYVKLFLDIDDAGVKTYGDEKFGNLYIDLVSETLANSGYSCDKDLSDAKILVNVSDAKTGEKKQYTLNYTGYTSSAKITLPYGEYNVSAYFAGNSKYKPAELEGNVEINDESVLNSTYSGDYKTYYY
ncbi:hypothetical protein [Methanobrevibacter sp.]|uniref:hypothetical protein n=1 Tax=Methanobrevibacter sp. TaxID=66852 RepID=UPI0026E0620B|nr:hypothetical protein [Methanobrevibacter sp.]MDO5859568.1 hypothetical protein [Methanobrevibacter sp.]